MDAFKALIKVMIKLFDFSAVHVETILLKKHSGCWVMIENQARPLETQP